MAVNFREKAKEKLLTAENLSSPVCRVPSHWWIAAAGGILAAGAFLAWVFLGQIPMLAEGSGVYIQEKNEVLCFVQLENASGIENDMKVSMSKAGGDSTALTGYISEAESRWISQEELLGYVRGNESFLRYLTDGVPVAVYHCRLTEGAGGMPEDGEVLQVEIQKESVHPIDLWL